MAWFLYLVSATWIAFGSCAILYTEDTRILCRDFISTTHHKILSVLPLIAGLLLIISASASAHPWLIGLFGIVGMAKGGFAFMNPKGMFENMVKWYFESVSDQGHRFTGIIAIILGTAVLSWIV